MEKAYRDRFDMININHDYKLIKLNFETNAIEYPKNTYVHKTKEMLLMLKDQRKD
ncbi:MAG: hypothetical protein N4A63_16900 [Vallitalea sp.]|nr:hypothetical protein [Vallitalea sp.]